MTCLSLWLSSVGICGMPTSCLNILLNATWYLALKEEFQAVPKVKGQEPSFSVESLKWATERIRLTNDNFQLLMLPVCRTELSWATTALERGERDCKNTCTLIILYKVSSGIILAHLHLKKTIKILYEIHFCFSNFLFFVYSPHSSIFANELPPRQFWCFINQQAVEAWELQQHPQPVKMLPHSSLPRWLPCHAFFLGRSCATPRTYIWCCYHSNGRELKVTATPWQGSEFMWNSLNFQCILCFIAARLPSLVIACICLGGFCPWRSGS